MTEYVNLLDEITKDRTLPTGYDGWLIRSVHPDLTSSNDYRYPSPGEVAKASGPFSTHGNECPDYPGDGICAAKDWRGMASGGIPAITLLLVAYRDADVLHRGGSEWRLRKFMVVDLLDGVRVVREHGAGADLYGANLYGANLGDWRRGTNGYAERVS